MYSSRITRATPSAVVLLVDQSRSMQERVVFNSNQTTKAHAVAWAANTTLAEFVNRSRREEGVRDYFHIAALGYGAAGIYPLVGGSSGARMIPVSRLAAMNVPRHTFLRERTLPDGRTMVATATQRVWIEPRAEGNTPMVGALDAAHDTLRKWCRERSHSKSFPPVVINITDGEASDGGPAELLAAAGRLRSLATGDGNVLLLNIHITSGGSGVPALFPSSATEVGGAAYARLLFEMSSPLPPCYNDAIAAIKGAEVVPPRTSGPASAGCEGGSASRGVDLRSSSFAPRQSSTYGCSALGLASVTTAPTLADPSFAPATPAPAPIAVASPTVYRGMSYNCPVSELLAMLDIGTVSVNLIR